MTSKIPFERFTVTVDYKSILPAHRDLVLDALESFGAPMPLPDSLFEGERFVVSFSAQTEDHEISILEGIRAAMSEVYGPVGAAWSRIDGEWS